MFFERFHDSNIVKKLNSFFRSKYMVAIIIALAALSNIFGLELPVYYIYTAIVVLTVLFCEDMLPILPMACCGYMTFSRNSNPLGVEESTFRNSNNILQLIIIASIIGIFALSRVIFDIVKHPERRTKPKLLLGFILILITNLIGGYSTKYFGSKTMFYGLLHAISISFTYFLFYYTINWRKVKKDHFMFILLTLGLLMLSECLNMYIECGNFSATEGFQRKYVFTGWGMYNNVALMCVLFLSAPFYYINTNIKRKKLPYILLVLLMYLNLFLLQSRNGILFGTLTLILCTLASFKRTHNRKILFTTAAITVVLLVGFFMIAIPGTLNLFLDLVAKGFFMGDRYAVYNASMKLFFDNPIAGAGFYGLEGYVWNLTSHIPGFLPPRCHNTYIQILASCGILGILAYIVHRIQTIKVIRSCDKNIALTVMKISLVMFMLMSILDCHFHNLGPGLMYSAYLLVIEKMHYKEKEDF